MTMLRTQELRKVQEQILAGRREVAEVQKSVLDVQKSVDDLNLKQGGTSSKMRADLTSMLTELQTQIGRLRAEIDETQHRLGQLGQKLDKLEQRKIVVSGPSPPAPQGSADTSVNSGTTGTAPTVKVVEGLDLENLFNQSREDYIRGKYDLAYKGFNTVYEKDAGGSYKEAAEYWMAECLWKGGKTDKALEIYQRVIQEFPKGGKACASRFKLGLIHDQKKDEGRRDAVWKQLLDECPQSNEAERAREMMKP
jgi:TolA-binding protein